MPRVTYVKAAQQRFYTKPVLDQDGNPTYRENQRKRPTKRGATVTRQRITVADRERPKPNLRCDFAGCQHPDREIAVGQSYKWMKPKSGPYGGTQRNRHAEHPSWHPWEYSSSLSARIQEIQHNAQEALSQVDNHDDAVSALSDVADAIRELAEEKREGASNIEDGFGHPTSQSEELEQIADDLDSWADDVENADIPDDPDAEDAEPEECPECEGEGTKDIGEGDEECAKCIGSGEVQPDEPTEAQMDEWREEFESACSIVDESPV